MSTKNGNTSTTTQITTPAHADRRRADWIIRARTRIADSTLIQAVLAGALSFTHIRDVALHYHQAGWKSWVYPLSVDLLTVAAYRRLKTNRATDQPTDVAWICFIMGLAASLAANIADALANTPTGAGHGDLTGSIIIGVWPAVAFLASTLLGHGAGSADQPAAEPAVDRRPTAKRRPANRPTAPTAPPADNRPADRPTDEPRPIPVQPTGRLGDLGPRAATTGELPAAAWVTIGHPLYLDIKRRTGGRPSEREFGQALADRVAELIADGTLPPAVGRPSTTTAKRARTAIETAHPGLRPLRLAAATA